MNRALVTFVLFALTSHTFSAEPKPGESRKIKPIHVILKADLHEVDGAFYKDLARLHRPTSGNLEDLEREFLNPTRDKTSAPSLFTRLEEQKRLLTGKEISVDPGEEAMVLDVRKPRNFLPTPAQISRGKKETQTVQEGLSLIARIAISADRRFVRVQFLEKSVEVEGSEKVPAAASATESNAEIVFLREGMLSQMRDIPDGGGLLLPIQYRPATLRGNDRWLVAHIVPRIYIEEEERLLRGKAGK